MSMREKIQIQIHPRALVSFGEELVTNDTVAITELIKNSYDAFAEVVDITFGHDENKQPFIKIQDDGCGMTRDTILNAWAVLATPYKKKNPIVRKVINGNEKIRIVSGNKGLGRFSAARLGDEMYVQTKHNDDVYLEVFFDWTTFDRADQLSDCNIVISENSNKEIPNESGTIIIIKKLHSVWDENKIEQLKNDLSRLVSPFEEVNDFKILIHTDTENGSIEIKPHNFINNPIYKIKGCVDKNGNISWEYLFNHLYERKNTGTINWDTIKDIDNNSGEYTCGKFSFEIRAWDLDSERIAEVSEQFNIGRRDIRKNISTYKGLSVYRDGVLVLPKSETNRDWLGLDAKRISRIGSKISTSQIIGIVNISNELNPNLKDTTDRERLVDNTEYRQFTTVLYSIMNKLETERSKDKEENKKRTNLMDIIAPLSSKSLVLKIENLIEQGKSCDEILDNVKMYDIENEKHINILNDRLLYYAQTASLGSVAIVIMHEFRTALTIIKRFLNNALQYKDSFNEETSKYLEGADKSHARIIEVTNSFAPLYNKGLRKKNNITNLKEAIFDSVSLLQSKKICENIEFVYEIDNSVNIAISDGELQTILINLFDNACFWIKESANKEQKIYISIEELGNKDKVIINVSDTGTGIQADEVDKIFFPGITSKTYGIGMGLVIVSEILSYYNCKIATRIPGDVDGATFIFELPLKG